MTIHASLIKLFNVPLMVFEIHNSFIVEKMLQCKFKLKIRPKNSQNHIQRHSPLSFQSN